MSRLMRSAGLMAAAGLAVLAGCGTAPAGAQAPAAAQFGIGLAARGGYHISSLAGPDRVVIDFSHPRTS